VENADALANPESLAHFQDFAEPVESLEALGILTTATA